MLNCRLRMGAAATILAVLILPKAFAEVLLHETFQDNDIQDGQPAEWELDFEMSAVDYTIEDGELSARFHGLSMWRVLSVNGQELEPSNNWSIRARIEPQRLPNDSIGGAGVGTDELYWADHDPIWQGEVTPVGTGHFTNPSPENNGVALPHFNEYVVQMDLSPEGIEGQMWLVDDPATISKSWWYAAERGEPDVTPGLPVIWGNDGGLAIFREVVVATEPMGTGGDFNRDNRLDSMDIDELGAAINANSNDPRFNLTSDLVVNVDDLEVWVHHLKQTYFGDANLDGEFNSSDLVSVFEAGQYEDSLVANSNWSSGDWNADGEFSSGDLVVAFQDGGYEQGPLAATAAVPEPSSLSLCWLGLLAIGCRPRLFRRG